MKRLLLFWPGVSGYTAACLPALAAMPDIDLRVVIIDVPLDFSPDVMKGFSYRLLRAAELTDASVVESLVAEHSPDVLYIPGWRFPTLRRLAGLQRFEKTRKWIGVDTPWRRTWRQQIARLLLRRYMSRFDRVFVPGERGFQYMRMLGVAEGRIRKSLLAIDYDAFAQAHARRRQKHGDEWPAQFLYIGRYVPAKALPVLVDGYRRYRNLVSDPWRLTCAGSGPDRPLLLNQPGIQDRGFCQPAQLLDVMLDAGAMVIASSYEPWGLVVPEALASGLPVICTEAVSSSVELVRSFYNGITVPTNDPPALARAMLWMHNHRDQLPAMGQRGNATAAAYSAQQWAIRWAQEVYDCTTSS